MVLSMDFLPFSLLPGYTTNFNPSDKDSHMAENTQFPPISAPKGIPVPQTHTYSFGNSPISASPSSTTSRRSPDYGKLLPRATSPRTRLPTGNYTLKAEEFRTKKTAAIAREILHKDSSNGV